MRTTDRGSRDSAPGSPVKDQASSVNCHIIARRSPGVRAVQYACSACCSSSKLRKTLAVTFGRGVTISILLYGARVLRLPASARGRNEADSDGNDVADWTNTREPWSSWGAETSPCT